MQIFFAGDNQIKRDAIAVRRLHAFKEHQGTREKVAAIRRKPLNNTDKNGFFGKDSHQGIATVLLASERSSSLAPATRAASAANASEESNRMRCGWP
jgi:hypothetical protein